MKTFIFKQETIKRSKMYGSRTVECSIYKVVNNTPIYIGSTTFNTASTMGAIGEVNNWLTVGKYISNLWNERRKGSYYYCYRTEAASKKYQIVEV